MPNRTGTLIVLRFSKLTNLSNKTSHTKLQMSKTNYTCVFAEPENRGVGKHGLDTEGCLKSTYGFDQEIVC